MIQVRRIVQSYPLNGVTADLRLVLFPVCQHLIGDTLHLTLSTLDSLTCPHLTGVHDGMLGSVLGVDADAVDGGHVGCLADEHSIGYGVGQTMVSVPPLELVSSIDNAFDLCRVIDPTCRCPHAHLIDGVRNLLEGHALLTHR